ncbi:MAG: hypothetical protein ABW167_01025 [Baekduia sp.]
MRLDLAVILGAFVVVTLIAEVLGATNFGTALTFGTMAFAGALVFVLVRRP